MAKTTRADVTRNYRERLRASGQEEIIVQLPSEVIELIDRLKVARGLRNRSQVLLQFIEEGGHSLKQTA
jgi:hypothetical protein